MAMIALGVSEDDVPNSPPRKDLKEVVTFIKQSLSIKKSDKNIQIFLLYRNKWK